MALFLVDIDGTCADLSHRAHLVNHEDPDWERFNTPDLVYDDKPIDAAREGISRIKRRGHAFRYLTGRKEVLRQTTLRWLGDHGFISAPLYMRPDDCEDGATAFKRGQVERLIRETTNLIILVDDDRRVIDGLSDLIVCLQAPVCWPFIMPEYDSKDDPKWRL